MHTTNRVKNACAGIGAWRAMRAVSWRRAFIAGAILCVFFGKNGQENYTI